MAPSPEHDKEPKAPDKSDNKPSSSEAAGPDIRSATELVESSTLAPAGLAGGPAGNPDTDTQESSVSTLDDVQLKSLLDEAINYKTPKDREGKSQIFKDLLQEAEEDERNARAASASGPQLARYYNTAAIGAARRHRNRKESSASSTLTHGGSLQDLAQSDLYTDTHHVSGGGHTNSGRRAGGRRHRQNHPVTGQKTVSVSARQREGGSLPSNVNAGARNLLFDDYEHKTKKTDDVVTTPDVETSDVKPEYTIVELGTGSISDNIEVTDVSSSSNQNNTSNSNASNSIDLSESVDETRSLLMKETRNYSTLESNQVTTNSSDVNVPKYRYPHGDIESPDKDDAPVTPNTNTSGKRGQYEQHQVSRHQYFNPLEEYNKLPRLKYTSMAKVEIDGVNTNVDKAISFSQFSNEAGTLQLDGDYGNVRCVVDGAAGAVATAPAHPTTESLGQSTTTTVVSSVSGRAHALTKLTSDYRLLALPTNTKAMERFKGLDENGNSLQSSASLSSSGTFDAAKKKAKKSKVDRNVCVLDAKDIAGHQADIIQDIDQLVKYIEENDDKTTPKGTTNKHHIKNQLSSGGAKKDIGLGTTAQLSPLEASTTPSAAVTKKPKRVKTKSETSTPKSRLKKSNSLEEISKTKFTDLMNSDGGKRARVTKQSTSEDGDGKKEEMRGDRRSWGTEDSQQYMLAKHQRDVEPFVSHETAEFHVVTKKKKSKKRTTSSSSRFDDKHAHHYHYHRIDNVGGHQQQHYTRDKTTGNSEKDHHGRTYHRNVFSGENSVPTRRKSACSVPPSDKSGESSDGDSVHSLPAATTRRKQTNNSSKTECDENEGVTATSEFNDTLAALVAVGNTSPGSNTSYADIARNNNIMQQLQHQQSPQPQQKSSIALKSTEHFPELLCPLESKQNDDEILTKNDEFPALCNNNSAAIVQPSNQINPQNQMNPQNQINQINQMNPLNQINPINQMNPLNQMNQINPVNQTHPVNQPHSNQQNQMNQSTIDVVVNKSSPRSSSSNKQCVKTSEVRAKATIITNNVVVRRPPVTNNQLNNISRLRVVPPTAATTTSIISSTTTTTTAAATLSTTSTSSLSSSLFSSSTSSSSSSARPAVIILNDCPKDDLTFVQQSPSEPIQVSGLTFGFELNEQLLNDEFTEKQTNIVSAPLVAQQQHFCARFMAPPGDVRDNYNHDKIVQFIGMAWEEMIHENKGKIQYYNGQ